MSKRKVNPLAFGLMGFAKGFLDQFVDEWRSERARQAKMQEARELNAIAQQNRVDERAWQDTVREDEQLARKEEYTAQEAAQNARLDKQLGTQVAMNSADNARMASEGAADRAARAADREAQREYTKELQAARLGADPMTAWVAPDGTHGTSPWSEMPAGATPVQVGGKNQYTKGPGQPSIMSPGAGVYDPNKFVNSVMGH